MGLPLRLRTSFPENLSNRYYSHNSGQEHFSKHVGDIDAVQQSRLERGLHEIDGLDRIMHRGGLRVIWLDDAENTRGGLVGYGAVSKSEDGKDLRLEDIWVDEAHRHQGIASYLLGKVITSTPLNFGPIWLEKQIIGKSISSGTKSFILPGVIYRVSNMAHGESVKPEYQQEFYDWLPGDWTGIIVSNREGHRPAEQYIDGSLVAGFVRHQDGKYTIDGSSDERKFDNIAIAAIEAINP